MVGVGSVGGQDFVVLLEGEGAADPLYLQMNQAVRQGAMPMASPVGETLRRIRAANEAEPEIHSDLPGWQDLSPEPAGGEQ